MGDDLKQLRREIMVLVRDIDERDRRIASLESSLAEARKGARTPAPQDLLDFANEVMSLHEVGAPEYRLAEYVWVNR